MLSLRSFRKPIALGSLAVLFFATPAQLIGMAASAQADALQGGRTSLVIGTVVAAQGSWCDRSQEPCVEIWKMYPVKESSQLVPLRPNGGPLTITIRSRGGVKETFDCTQPRELGCKKPLDLSRLIVQEKQNNVLTAFWNAIAELAADRPKVYDSFRQAILQSRGSDQQRLLDRVAEITRNGLNLQGAVASLPAGKYLLELCPMNEANEPTCPNKPVDYSWDPNKPSSYPAGDLQPGMYRLCQWDDSAAAPRRTRNCATLLAAD